MCQSPIHRDTHFYIRRPSRSHHLRMWCVNPLSIGTPISTQLRTISTFKSPVSIPYPSGHPFLQSHKWINWLSVWCVNPLSIGTPISTKWLWVLKWQLGLCQSPIHRDTHFYGRKGEKMYAGYVCQSPIHRDTHFYQNKCNEEARTGKVSIPYPSGHPFLHV